VIDGVDAHLTSGMTRLVRLAILTLSLVMGFCTFQFFPGMSNLQEAWFVFCFLTFLLLYPFLKTRAGLRFSRFEFYLLLLITGDVVIAAWRAQVVFGQPIIYGILTQRNMALVAMLLLLLDALRSGMVELADIEAVLLFLAWATAALYSAMRLLLSPSNFLAYGDGFVTRPMPGEQPSFKFSETFVLFGVFYYAMLGLRTRRVKYYLLALGLFLTTLGPSGRGLTVSVIAALFFFLYRLRGLGKALTASIKFACVSLVLVAATYIIFPALVSTRLTGFANAFTVVLTGSATTTDPSANARIFESLAALPFIQKHPFLGNGVVSHQWQDGYGTLLGENFFPADIGVVGIVFSYGILGFLLFLFQYRFAWKAAKGLVDSFHSPLLDATQAFLLFTAFYTAETGTCVWTAEMTLFFVVLMVGISRRSLLLSVFDTGTERECGLQESV
jgi:O-Antigen ligase